MEQCVEPLADWSCGEPKVVRLPDHLVQPGLQQPHSGIGRQAAASLLWRHREGSAASPDQQPFFNEQAIGLADRHRIDAEARRELAHGRQPLAHLKLPCGNEPPSLLGDLAVDRLVG